MEEFVNMLPKLVQTQEWQDAQTELGTASRVVIALWIFAKLESNFQKHAKSSRGAKGMYQFLPSTISAFSKKYPSLPPWDDNDLLAQSRYALRHLFESHRVARQREPKMALAFPGLFAKMRFFYHNGPSVEPKFPKESAQDQQRLREYVMSFLDPKVLW